jgi:protein-disulfide isomerase
MTAATPTKKDRRDQARSERLEREQAEAAAAARRRRFTRLGAVLAVAAVVVVALVAVSSSGGGGDKTAATGSAASSSSSASSLAGVQASADLLKGIPQDGISLGSAKAPVRVLEFADLQCPFCRQATLDVLPNVIKDYVRPGKVRMEFHALAFIGPDSVRAARVAEAAGRQDKLWNVTELAYHNQGEENSGWATDATLKRITGAVPGLDTNKVFAARNGAGVTNALKAAGALATAQKVDETPTFLVGRGNDLKATDAAGLTAAIKAAVGS